METLTFVSSIAKSTLYISVVLLALIYSLPILCIRRFQHRNNIFTLNVCLTMALNCLMWLPTTISPLFSVSRDSLLKMLPGLYVPPAVSDMAIPYSLVLVSLHRCCSIVYPQKRLFQTRTWMAVCFAGQWIIAVALSIPFILFPLWVSASSRNE